VCDWHQEEAARIVFVAERCLANYAGEEAPPRVREVERPQACQKNQTGVFPRHLLTQDQSLQVEGFTGGHPYKTRPYRRHHSPCHQTDLLVSAPFPSLQQVSLRDG